MNIEFLAAFFYIKPNFMKSLKIWYSILYVIILLLSACKDNKGNIESYAPPVDTASTALASDTPTATLPQPNEENSAKAPAKSESAPAPKTKLPTQWIDEAGTKLAQWTAYHGKSIPDFSMKKFVAIDTFQDMDFPELPMEKTDPGFNDYRIASPDGQRQLDIYCFEKKLKKAKNGKTSLAGTGKNAEVALLNSQADGNKTRLLHCDAHCHFDDAVWLDNHTIVVAGYSDEVDKKLRPMLWRIDLKNRSVWRYLYPEELPAANKTYITDVVFAQ
jgi:hypothetical protein